MVAVTVVLAGCQQDMIDLGGELEAPEGYVALKFEVNVPDMQTVKTRAVDPDARGIETMRLFCFDDQGLFVSTATPTELSFDEGDYQTSGTFTANVLDYTRIIHFAANVNLDEFHETDYIGQSEEAVMTSLVGSSSTMVYWGRVAAGEEGIDAAMQAASPIPLVRNQARVRVSSENNDAGVPYFTVEGFAVINTSAFGTLASYNRVDGTFDWLDIYMGDNKNKYVTLPPNTVRASMPSDVTTPVTDQYVFETENSDADPVSVIVKGKNAGEEESLYYRVLLLDENQDPISIWRNHSYNITITGALSYGYATFAEATEGAATNNIYVSIGDEIKSVTDGEHTLTLEETTFIQIGADTRGTELTFNFSLTKNSTNGAADAKPSVTWMEGSDVGYSIAESSISYKVAGEEGADGSGTVNLSLFALQGQSKREGMLLIKYGQLQRKVKVILIKKQVFAPAWASTNILNTKSEQNVTLMFSIPEDTPAELLPLRVLISVNDMDIRSEAGVQLEVITPLSAPDEYGEDNGIGYKYVYVAESTGTQRIYLKTLQASAEPGSIRLENTYFETVDVPYTYSSGEYFIGVPSLGKYEGAKIEEDDEEGSEDDDTEKEFIVPVYYCLAPQKINAPVSFEFGVYTDEKWTTYFSEDGLQTTDEFLMYTQNLGYYPNTAIPDPVNPGQTIEAQCNFVEEVTDIPEFEGNVLGFYPIESGRSTRTIYMYTKKAFSDEVVRIKSNVKGSASIKDPTATYEGGEFKSVTFELSTYRAFDFTSTVKGAASKTQEWDYAYGADAPVDIAFNLTSFIANDGNEVDPFGTSFNVYIDAPMLAINVGRARTMGLNTDEKTKFYKAADGRFVYVVEKTRDAERAYGVDELKTLPFIVDKVVSAGQISISADPNIVVYNTETYTITNAPITGTLKYGTAESSNYVPATAFISFERSRDRTRIGSVKMGADDAYTLTLRGEYTLNWNNEKVLFRYTDTENKEYVKEITDLNELCTQLKGGVILLQ